MKQRVRSELREIRGFDSLESAHLEDAIRWVESDAPLFRLVKPATPAKHLVSYFALVDSQHILLVDHKLAQLWLPSGGHVEPNEDPRATVVREIKEELGITIALEMVGPPLMVTVTQTVGMTSVHTDVSLWYVVPGDRFASIAFDPEEFHAAQWFPFAEIPQRCEPHLKRFLAKLMQTP